MQEGLELHGIEVSPGAFFPVILHRVRVPARGAGDWRPTRPFDRDVDAFFIRIEVQRRDLPGRGQPEQLTIVRGESGIDGHDCSGGGL